MSITAAVVEAAEAPFTLVEVEADEVAVSLRWATARPARARERAMAP